MTFSAIATTIKTLIAAQWGIADPPIADLKFCLENYGMDTAEPMFDPNACYPQIAVEETGITVKYVSGLMYKHEHTIQVTAFLRPVNYQAATIATFETTFKAMIAEIDRILMAYKFTITGVNDLRMTGWADQTKKGAEPIVFMAVHSCTAVDYHGSL